MPLKNLRLRSDLAELDRETIEYGDIPYLDFDKDWLVKVTYPQMATFRFRVTTRELMERKPSDPDSVSVYFDADNTLGCNFINDEPFPYWEIFCCEMDREPYRFNLGEEKNMLEHVGLLLEELEGKQMEEII